MESAGHAPPGSAKAIKAELDSEKTKALHTLSRMEKALNGVGLILSKALAIAGDQSPNDMHALMHLVAYIFLNDSEKVELLC